MEYLLDTIHLDDISRFCEYLPISGVTSNPSIVKKEGSIDFFSHMRQIRNLIGKERTFHIQVTSEDTEGMLKDAEAILRHVDEGVYIKVPINWNGLKAIKQLKSQGVRVTGTAIYTVNQGFLALEAGADYIAPYYNRMESLNIDPEDGIRSFASMIKQYGYGTRILAASFRNIAQVNKSFLSGSQAATVEPSLLSGALSMPDIEKAVSDFSRDWGSLYGGRQIADLQEMLRQNSNKSVELYIFLT